MHDMSGLIRPLTQEEIDSFPTDVVIDLEAPFADSRGAIQPLVDETMKAGFGLPQRRAPFGPTTITRLIGITATSLRGASNITIAPTAATTRPMSW